MSRMQQVQNFPAKVICDDFYRDVIKPVSNGMYFVGKDFRISFWNKAAERLTGFSSCKVLGHRCGDNILRHVTENGKCLCENGCPLAATLRDGIVRESYIFLHHRDGYRVPVHVSVAAQRDVNGTITGAVETFSGNTVYMKSLNDLKHSEDASFLDPQTGLANEQFMQIAFESRVAEMRRYQSAFGVIMVKLDRHLRETYDEAIYSLMIKAVSQTLLLNCRSNDLVGRWKDDEFLLLAPLIYPDELDELARRLCVLVASSWLNLNEEKKVSLSASFGAAMSKPDDDMDQLSKRVSMQLDQSIAAGGNRVAINKDNQKT